MPELTGTELGIDMLWGADVDPLGRWTSGIALLRQDLMHRITCARGRLITDPDYGIDIKAMLSKPLTKQERSVLPRNIEAEIRKDPRVDPTSVNVTLDEPSTGVWRITITGQSLVGPFELVVSVDRAGEVVLDAAA